ncbi:hypothetical protein [Schleiferilactobacillus harbinensis]|uniref:hypothetical protein n=1 Tax=Schleiferilactobacillus harbinensis TaxID=304207 RepID=UPI0039E92603
MDQPTILLGMLVVALLAAALGFGVIIDALTKPKKPLNQQLLFVALVVGAAALVVDTAVVGAWWLFALCIAALIAGIAALVVVHRRQRAA